MLKKLAFFVSLFAMAFTVVVYAGVPRSQAAKVAFAKTHVCPSTGKFGLPCPKYVIDHKKALDCGGLDVPQNMQYQALAAGKAKDRIERNGPGCKHRTRA